MFACWCGIVYVCVLVFGQKVAAGVACRVHNVRKCPVSTRLVSELSPPTSSILVEEIPLAVGKEELEMYFESKKRSGGSEIADIAYDTEKQVAVVTFTSTYGKYLHECVLHRCCVCRILSSMLEFATPTRDSHFHT